MGGLDVFKIYLQNPREENLAEYLNVYFQSTRVCIFRIQYNIFWRVCVVIDDHSLLFSLVDNGADMDKTTY